MNDDQMTTADHAYQPMHDYDNDYVDKMIISSFDKQVYYQEQKIQLMRAKLLMVIVDKIPSKE